MTETTPLAPAVEPPLCPHCAKPEFLCVCDAIEPLQTKIGLLILQHPQEQDRQLGTAKLAHRALKNSVLKIGLSWPSLAKALGREADPGEWAVLHLGATRPTDLPRDREVVVLDKKGVSLPDQDKALAGHQGRGDFRRLLGAGQDLVVAQRLGAQGQETGAQPARGLALRQIAA